VDTVKEQMDEEILFWVRRYLEGHISPEELAARIDSIVMLAGARKRGWSIEQRNR
jgi:hypothetical protein